jgi:MFS superfamily sulfate permease-like transporter
VQKYVIVTLLSFSQVKHFMGVKLKNTDTALETFIEVVKHLGDTKWREFVMGFGFLILLLAMKRLGQKSERFKWTRPLGPLTVCALSIIIVVAGDLDNKENKLIKTVGYVQRGEIRSMQSQECMSSVVQWVHWPCHVVCFVVAMRHKRGG